MTGSGLQATERRGAVSLAGIFALRMLGLFMLYPVFAVYARQLPGATPALIGIALGIYGLTQASLQLPFGWASDRLGRKPIIGAGLLIFVAGSVVAALAHGIGGIILGRAIQGAGAVGAAILALAADLTRPEQRTKAVGIIGAGIGLAFAVALIAGPAVNAWWGLAGIFWLTGALGILALGTLRWVVPRPGRARRHRETEAVPGLLLPMLADRGLLRLYLSIFLLHAMLAALFLGVPVVLRAAGGLTPRTESLFYLPVLALGFVAMIPAIIVAETRGRMKAVALTAIAVLALAAVTLVVTPKTLLALAAVLFFFFSAFTLMEALLPSLVSRLARPEAKGTALGIYSTSQFLGIFVGGAVGGAVQERFGASGAFAFVALAGGFWWLLMLGFRPPQKLAGRILEVRVTDSAQAERLARRLEDVTGVAQASVFVDDGTAHLRVDPALLDESELSRAVEGAAGASALDRMGPLRSGERDGEPRG